jgi:hypothetical protein
MWVESQVHVGNDSIGLRIERLDADACERTAAVFAWLTLEAMRSGAEAVWPVASTGICRCCRARLPPVGSSRSDMARIDWAVLCDQAFMDRHERLSVIGVTRQFPVPRLPIALHQVMLAAHLTDIQPVDEIGIGVSVVSPQGALVRRRRRKASSSKWSERSC